MTDFNYKEYSLSQLENWIHDAMSSGEATPQEIYDTIHKVVSENYYIYKNQTSKAYELLALLNGNGKGHIKAFDDCVDKVLSCDKNDKTPECKGAWNSFWQENTTHDEMTADGFWIPKTTETVTSGASQSPDKVKRWVLPVQQKIEEGIDDYYIQFPDELLDLIGLKEGDRVEWVDRGDGSYLLKKAEITT